MQNLRCQFVLDDTPAELIHNRIATSPKRDEQLVLPTAQRPESITRREGLGYEIKRC